MKKSNIITQIGVFIGIVLVVNLISNKLFFRLDFTADQRYTLSNATKDILNELDDVITITAYFTEDLPPQLLSNKKDFEDILIEYENRSGGNIVYEFLNPNESEDKEREAQQAGIGPLMINVQESDQVKQMRAYMGVVLQMGDKKEIIPVIQPGAAMEYSLTTSIKKISVSDKPSIAFIQGHGEPSLRASMQVLQQLSVLYNIEPYTLTDTAEIPKKYRAIAIVAPKDTIPNTHLQKFDTYMKNGGGIYISYTNLEAELTGNGALKEKNDIGLKSWLQDKGIIYQKDFVIDANCNSVSVPQQRGPFTLNVQVQFPYFPKFSNFGDHPVSKGLESVFLSYVNAISLDIKDSSVIYTPLVRSSEQSGLVTAPSYIEIQKDWQRSDFTQGSQIAAVAVEGNIIGNIPSKLVVIANGTFAVNGDGNDRNQISSENANLAVNAIDWLSDDTGLIDLRTKGVTSRPLDQIEDSTKEMIKYGNMLLPIILLLIYGFIRKQKALRRRQAWVEGHI